MPLHSVLLPLRCATSCTYFIARQNGLHDACIGAVAVDNYACLQMDSSGDLFAAGYSADADSSGDINFLVVKLSGFDGSTMWTFSPNTTSGDVFHGVDLDERGNVFVAGGEGAPDIEGKFATTPVITKINGFTGEEMWSYRGADGDRIIFNSVAVDQNTGWVVGAGATR